MGFPFAWDVDVCILALPGTGEGRTMPPVGRLGYSAALLGGAAGVDADDVDEDVVLHEVEDVVAVQGGVDVAGREGDALAAGDRRLWAHEQPVLVAEEAVGAVGELRGDRD